MATCLALNLCVDINTPTHFLTLFHSCRRAFSQVLKKIKLAPSLLTPRSRYLKFLHLHLQCQLPLLLRFASDLHRLSYNHFTIAPFQIRPNRSNPPSPHPMCITLPRPALQKLPHPQRKENPCPTQPCNTQPKPPNTEDDSEVVEGVSFRRNLNP